MWDIGKGQLIKSISKASNYPISICFSPDSNTFSEIGDKSIIRIWNTTDGGLTKEITFNEDLSIAGLSFTPDGNSLIGSSNLSSTKKIFKR